MRYTVTFKKSVQDIDASLSRLQEMGVQIRSAQRFIGTAIVEADAAQAKQLESLDEVAAVTESSRSFSVI
jgi:hypothetical protein